MSDSKIPQEEPNYTIKHKGIIYYQGPYNSAAKLLSQSLNLKLEPAKTATHADDSRDS